MKTVSARGFTLIELLVVIAIIGILSAVVLAQLSTARSKGQDAATKKSLTGARAQAELFYYANNNSYNLVCGSAPVGTTKSVYAQVNSAATAQSLAGFSRNAIGTTATATCNDAPGGWAVEVPLKAGGMFCVDYTGASLSSASFTLTTVADVTCGP